MAAVKGELGEGIEMLLLAKYTFFLPVEPIIFTFKH